MLEGDVVAVEAVGAAPNVVLLDDVVLVEHVGHAGHAYGQEQARVGVVGRLVVVSVVEGVDVGQTVRARAIGVDEVLRGLVEVAAAVGDVGDAGRDEAVAPVEVAVGRTVVAGVLYGPDALSAVLVALFGAEVVVDVLLEAVVAVVFRVGVFDDLLQIVLVD